MRPLWFCLALSVLIVAGIITFAAKAEGAPQCGIVACQPTVPEYCIPPEPICNPRSGCWKPPPECAL